MTDHNINQINEIGQPIREERMTENLKHARSVWQSLTPAERTARRGQAAARREELAERRARRELTKAARELKRAERERRARLHEEIAINPPKALATDPSYSSVRDYRPLGFCQSCHRITRDMETDSLCLDCFLCNPRRGESDN